MVRAVVTEAPFRAQTRSAGLWEVDDAERLCTLQANFRQRELCWIAAVWRGLLRLYAQIWDLIGLFRASRGGTVSPVRVVRESSSRAGITSAGTIKQSDFPCIESVVGRDDL